MKKIMLLALVIITFTSCRKDKVRPGNDIDGDTGNNTTINNPATSAEAIDEIMHHVFIEDSDQRVKTAVNGTTLSLIYTENVNALLTAQGYDQSFSIRFDEDFSGSALKNFDYTTAGVNGSNTFNWAGNNLKVLNEKTLIDTTVNGQAMIKIHLVRDFKFVKQYITAQEALQMQTAILNTTTDVVKFKAYVIFEKTYKATSSSKPLVYSK